MRAPVGAWFSYPNQDNQNDALDIRNRGSVARGPVGGRRRGVLWGVDRSGTGIADLVHGQAGARSNIEVKQQGGSLINVKGGTNLADVVKAINAIGANPQDLISILQAMKAANALRADLEII